MAKRTFKHKEFKAGAMLVVKQANEIIEGYMAKGYRLTARQLYYQFVTRNWIRNEEKSYKRLTNIISEARLAGLVDWNAIEDRGREPQAASEWANITDLARSAVRSFRLPRWEVQDWYVELWVEKQALAGVLWPIAYENHVTLMVNKGYSSQSAMYESAARFKASNAEHRKLLYLGDFDPSGEDMVRDIQERMNMFGAFAEVEKLALTWDQIEEYKPPPNPAKITDPRAGKYIERHGDSSWEVDALEPSVLEDLITDAILKHRDDDKWDLMLEKEKQLKKQYLKAVEKI